jgi:hypothetical protein
MPSFEKLSDKKGKLSDIVLHFGIWTGSRVSEMLGDPKGDSYIRNFLLACDSNFPQEFQDLITGVVIRNDPSFFDREEEEPPF